MQFSIGDKVVHPHHGPGQIIGAERREFLDGEKLYYEIEIPGQELSVHLPRKSAEEIGLRPAISRTKLPRALAKLRSKPRCLPKDYKQRQEEVWERLRTGRVMQVAEVVRDLAWHEKREHLTRKDTDHFTQGKSRLAAEMALASGTEVADMERTINDTLAAAIDGADGHERRHRQRAETAGRAQDEG